MIKQRLISLLVPRLVLVEFNRNRARIVADSTKSLSSHFRLVKDAVGKIGGDKRRMRTVLRHLDDVNPKLSTVVRKCGILDSRRPQSVGARVGWRGQEPTARGT